MVHLFVMLILSASVSVNASDGFSWGVGSAEIASPGQLTVSLETNSILRGRREAEYDGEVPPEGRAHFIFASSYAVLPFWETGAALLAGTGTDTSLLYGGFRLSQKMAIPNSGNSPFNLGMMLDLGQTTPGFAEEMWGAGLGPVISYRLAPFSLTANPYFSWSLSPGSSTVPSFDPSFRIAFTAAETVTLGLEYLISFGELGNFLEVSERDEMFFGTLDLSVEDLALGVSLGRGLTPVSVDWVGRLTIGTAI